MVDAEPTGHRYGAAGAAYSGMAAQAEAAGADPIGPRPVVNQHGLGCLHPSPQP